MLHRYVYYNYSIRSYFEFIRISRLYVAFVQKVECPFLVVLQDYLREQPDNIKSVNLIAETAQFLNLIYGSVNNKNVILITELFNTLVEFMSVCSIEVLHIVRLDVTQVT